MKVIDGIKLKGRPAEIPDCGRRQLPEFFREMGYKVGVEIGVQRGFFLKRLCHVGLTMYGVDPWECYDDYWIDNSFAARQQQIYDFAKDYVREYPKCTLIRKTSMEAVKDFEDESIDFVYIDGHHGFKYVTEDIFEWSKKVKKGGIISGHDYAYAVLKKNSPWILQVKYVIDAYTRAFKINNWWVLGAGEKTFEGEKRDQYRSWMWIKE